MWLEDIGRVKKIEDASEDSKAKLLVWRDKSKDHTRRIFPEFPDSLFDDERDKHAVLAHEASGVTIIAALSTELMKGAHCLTLLVLHITEVFSLQIQDQGPGSGHPPESSPFHTICLPHFCPRRRHFHLLAFPCDAEGWFDACDRRLQRTARCQHA